MSGYQPWAIFVCLVVGMSLRLVVPLSVRLYHRFFNYRRDWERAAVHAVCVLRERYPNAVPEARGRLYILHPETGMLWIVIDGDLAARVHQYAFDVILPVWAKRTLGPERADVCRAYIGEPTAENFSAFLNAHLGPDDGRCLPADLRTLADMQGAVWAAFYESGWPVLCTKTCFADEAVTARMFPVPVSA